MEPQRDYTRPKYVRNPGKFFECVLPCFKKWVGLDKLYFLPFGGSAQKGIKCRSQQWHVRLNVSLVIYITVDGNQNIW